MNIKEDAERLHNGGFNCAQSVLCACSEYTGLDDKTALALSAGFGGGVRCGEICGAISGAVMAIGCAYPFVDPSDKEAKARIAGLSKTVTGDFMEHFGCLRCLELKSGGVSCNEAIKYAAELAEKTIKENKEN